MSGGWSTIESDAGVFTDLVQALGVKHVQFEELISLDPTLLASLHPVHGVIFLFKYPTDVPYISSDGPTDGVYDYPAAERLFFAQQTIQNACATQALLSILLNKAPDSASATHVDFGQTLADFREFVMLMPSDMRGEALSNSDLIRAVHNSFAKANPFVDDGARPANDADAEDAFHFVAYTCVDDTLYELDGLQPAPISHGPCNYDGFAAKLVDVLRRRVDRYDPAEIRFNLMAVVRDLRLRAAEFGDAEAMAAERAKRRAWRFENALRKQNMLGYVQEVLKTVIRAKLSQDDEIKSSDTVGNPDTDTNNSTATTTAYDEWIMTALERRKRYEAAAKTSRENLRANWSERDVDPALV